MQSLVLALCLAWLSSSLAFPVSPVDSTSESALKSEPGLGLSIPADELPQSLGQHVLQSEWISAKAQTLTGTSTNSRTLRRRSDKPGEGRPQGDRPETELILLMDQMKKDLISTGTSPEMAQCLVVRLSHPGPSNIFSEHVSSLSLLHNDLIGSMPFLM